MKEMNNMKLVIETPEDYNHPLVQEYIESEIKRPSKRWVEHVINGVQEKEHVKIQHEKYLLLPDTERINRYWSLTSLGRKKSQHLLTSQSTITHPKATNVYSHRSSRGRECVILNWLAIVKEKNLHTIRNLTGEHIVLLKQIRDEALESIFKETKIPKDEVMIYVHYHPSVYQLHIHFAYPYMQYNHRDIYRMHPLNTIIHNLENDGDYYKKAHIQVSLQKDSVLYKVIKKKMSM